MNNLGPDVSSYGPRHFPCVRLWLDLNMGPSWFSTWTLDGSQAGPCMDLSLHCTHVSHLAGLMDLDVTPQMGLKLNSMYLTLCLYHSGPWMDLNLGLALFPICALHGSPSGPCSAWWVVLNNLASARNQSHSTWTHTGSLPSQMEPKEPKPRDWKDPRRSKGKYKSKSAPAPEGLKPKFILHA